MGQELPLLPFHLFKKDGFYIRPIRSALARRIHRIGGCANYGRVLCQVERLGYNTTQDIFAAPSAIGGCDGHDTTNTLKEIYTTLFNKMKEKGYTPKQQNVSINVRVNGYDIDLVPASIKAAIRTITASSAVEQTRRLRRT